MVGSDGTVGTVGTVCTVLGLGVGRNCRGAGGFIYSGIFAGIGGGGVFGTLFVLALKPFRSKWGRAGGPGSSRFRPGSEPMNFPGRERLGAFRKRGGSSLAGFAPFGVTFLVS